MDVDTLASEPSETVLYFYVGDFAGAIASTRESGQQVAEQLQRVVADADAQMIEVSFAGVETASAPFLQPLAQTVRSLGSRGSWTDLNDDIRETLAYVESRQEGERNDG